MSIATSGPAAMPAQACSAAHVASRQGRQLTTMRATPNRVNDCLASTAQRAMNLLGAHRGMIAGCQCLGIWQLNGCVSERIGRGGKRWAVMSQVTSGASDPKAAVRPLPTLKWRGGNVSNMADC